MFNVTGKTKSIPLLIKKPSQVLCRVILACEMFKEQE